MTDLHRADAEWTPETLAAYESAETELRGAFDALTAGLRSSTEAGRELPEVGALRDAVNGALWRLDEAAGALTGDYFDAVDVPESDEADDEEDAPEGLVDELASDRPVGVSVIWRLDLEVVRPRELAEVARNAARTDDTAESEADAFAQTSHVGAALATFVETFGMEALVDGPGIEARGAIRAYVLTDDLLDGGDAAETFVDVEGEDDLAWSRDLGSVLLPGRGTVTMSEGFHFG